MHSTSDGCPVARPAPLIARFPASDLMQTFASLYFNRPAAQDGFRLPGILTPRDSTPPVLVALELIPYSFKTYAQDCLGYQRNRKARRRPSLHRLARAQSTDPHTGIGAS